MTQDIPALVINHIRNSVLLMDELGKIIDYGKKDIRENIRHGPHTGLTSFEEGVLFGSVDGNIVSNDGLNAVIEFYANAGYASFQDEGTYDKSESGKGIAPREFMKYGIEDLIAHYGG